MSKSATSEYLKKIRKYFDPLSDSFLISSLCQTLCSCLGLHEYLQKKETKNIGIFKVNHCCVLKLAAIYYG